MEKYDIWLKKAVEDPDILAELKNIAGDADAINDRFYRDLEFGTGGLRGVIGAGTNRMNVYTVRKATKGLADWVLNQAAPKRVAIAHDSRNKGRLFALEAARTLSAAGIEAYVYPRLEPTPALSWAVRELGCAAGICVTASHNPAAYNGYKAYGPDGCQITSKAAEDIFNAICRVDPFSVPVDDKLIKVISEETPDKFIDAVLSRRVEPGGAPSKLKLVYTPLNGAGLECVTRVLSKAGYSDVTVVESQREPDGNFPTCPYPNPEIREAMAEGLKLCETVKPDLLLATDPDADRVGIAVPSGGEYKLLSGNETGVLLLDYICRRRIETGTMPERPVAVKTIVSTELAARVAAHYDVQLLDLLTGFKYIGEQIGLLEEKGEAGRFIFGFEESYGYLTGAHVRDKDAVNAALLICDMAAWYKANGVSLAAALENLYGRFGYCKGVTDSYSFPGERGMRDMENVMSALRDNPPGEIGGFEVVSRKDYLPGIDGLPPADVLQYALDDGSLVTVRPSGTEPKLKVYFQVLRENEELTLPAADKLRGDMKTRVEK